MKSIGATLVSSAIGIFLLFCLVAPLSALASASTSGAGGLVPCAGPDCQFKDVIIFANTIIDWLLRIAIPICAALFSYAGFLYLTSGGNPAKKTAANKVFQSVFWGFVMALAAWVIVNFLTNFFLGKDVEEVLPPIQNAMIETPYATV